VVQETLPEGGLLFRMGCQPLLESAMGVAEGLVRGRQMVLDVGQNGGRGVGVQRKIPSLEERKAFPPVGVDQFLGQTDGIQLERLAGADLSDQERFQEGVNLAVSRFAFYCQGKGGFDPGDGGLGFAYHPVPSMGKGEAEPAQPPLIVIERSPGWGLETSNSPLLPLEGKHAPRCPSLPPRAW